MNGLVIALTGAMAVLLLLYLIGMVVTVEIFLLADSSVSLK